MINQKLLIKCMLGVAVGLSSLMTYAATIEGYWQSIDDHTGEKLSIIEIKKDANNEYNGTIVQRFAVPGAQMMTHCTKCTGALKNKPIVGLEILTGFKKDPNKPNAYIDGLLCKTLDQSIIRQLIKAVFSITMLIQSFMEV